MSREQSALVADEGQCTVFVMRCGSPAIRSRTLRAMRRTCLSILSVCLLAAASVHATVLLPIEFRELVQSAQTIVHGRVVDVRSEWVDGRRAVETFVTIEAAE